MTQTFGEIGAAIPGLVMRRIRLVWAGLEKQKIPALHHGPHVQRERQLILRRGSAHRLSRHEKGIERLGVVARYQGEMSVGKSRIKKGAAAAHAVAQRTLE